MRRLSLLFAVLVLFAQISSALAGSSTLAVTPGSGANLRVGTDGATNLFGNGAICDGAACALLASVNAAGTPGSNGLAIQGLTGGVPVPVSQSGTWTVQPGNTANTTPWLTTGSVTGWAGGTIGTGTIQAFGATQGTIGAGLVPAFNAYIVNTLLSVEWNADGVANTTNGSPTTSLMMASNGTTIDRLQDDVNKSLKVAAQASPTGGASTSGAIVPNNTTAVVLKASAGTLYGVQLAGLGSAPAYLKLYNATSATCGSGTPVKRLIIPAASTAANGAGSNITFGPQGVVFGTGITYCVTTGITDADNTAPAASTFLVNVDWN